MNEVDPIILGHNQFIGVSHLSQDFARSKAEYFSDIKKVVDVVRICSELGVNGVMLSTHPRAKDILQSIADEGLSEKLNFYPLIPYAQGYVRKMNEKGFIGLLNDVLKPASALKKISILLQGSINLLKKDFTKLLGTLINLELLTFKDLNIKAVFLHNVLTDLGLGLQAREQFEFYIDYLKDNYGITPAFTTLNFVKLVKTFDEWGIKKPLIMTPFNKVGFQMNPSGKECEKCLKEYNIKVVAMSTLAAGYLKPKEAYEYVFKLPNIVSIVVGVSTKEHAEETFRIIRGYQREKK